MSHIKTSAAILTLFTCVVMMATPAIGAGSSGGSSGGGAAGFQARSEKRAASRWTLQEWLETKDRNRMMDLWLSMNSPSPYEFMLGGASLWAKLEAGQPPVQSTHTSYTGEIAAYAQFVGLQFEHENNTSQHISDLTGLLNLRLMGDSLQNSFLTLHAGQRTRNTSSNEQIRQIVLQTSLQIYLSKHFGIDGKYRTYQAATNAAGETLTGQASQAGLFIDFGAIRIFGAWSLEKDFTKSATVNDTSTRTSILSGLKIHY